MADNLRRVGRIMKNSVLAICLCLLKSMCSNSDVQPPNKPVDLKKLHERVFNVSSHRYHKNSWKVLEEVDGLKNEDVVFLITGSGAQGFSYVRERVIPSSRTWYRLLANVFYMIQDTVEARFALRHCAHSETPHFTTFNCHNGEPTYILSRVCSDINEVGLSGGICCKVDDMISYLIFDRPELFAHTKFAVEADDDTFFRVDWLLRWLAAVDNSGVNTFPIIGNANYDDKGEENVYHIKGCKEIHTNGWYQPMILNHASLDRLKYSAQSHGLTQICNNFNCYQDVAIGPYAWMHGLYHIHIPHTSIGGANVDSFNPEMMILHPMKHMNTDAKCGSIVRNKALRYKQNIAMGCGDIGHPIPGHNISKGNMNMDFYDVWELLRTKGTHVELYYDFEFTIWNNETVAIYPNNTMLPGISTTGDEQKIKIMKILDKNDKLSKDGTYKNYTVIERYIPVIGKLAGYETTQHAKKHNIFKKGGWAQFKLSDCKIKGVYFDG